MSLDVHVMPLAKFWAGEYTTGAERLAEQMGVPFSRLGNAKVLYKPAEAVGLAKGVRLWLEQEIGAADVWDDEGEVVFSEQFDLNAVHALRAFAAHLEENETTSAQRSFELTVPFHQHPALGRLKAGRATSFPHLIEHAADGGIYVPVDFDEPLLMMGGPFSIGSSTKLLRELARLRASLDPFPDWQSMRDGQEIQEPEPGLAWVKYGIAFLHEACWVSLRSRLPIVVDG